MTRAAHVPAASRLRASHARVRRDTHGPEDYESPLLASGAVYDQISVDEAGQVTSGGIAPGTLTAATFAQTVRPIAVVDALPTLPDANYPPLSYAVLTTDSRLYKNIADAWVLGVNGADIVADSITGGKIAAGVINTTHLAAGAITLYDESGQTLLSPLGFGPVWQRFLMSGFTNGDFYAAPATPANNIDESTNPLPAWTHAVASGTAITFKSIADSSTGSGRYIEMTAVAGAAGDKAYLEQIVPVVASKNQAWSFAPYVYVLSAAGSTDMLVFLEWQYLKRDGTTTGTGESESMASNHVFLLSGTEMTIDTVAGHGLQPPADAYYVRFRVGLMRKPAGNTAATATVKLYEALIVQGDPRIHIPEWTTPSSYGRGMIQQNNGVISIIPDALYTGTDRRATWLYGVLAMGAATFPTNPINNDLFFRTDLDQWFYYDSASGHWMSTTLFTVALDSISSLAASRASEGIGPCPVTDGSDIFLVDLVTQFLVNGGTALSGSHSWVGTFNKQPTGNTNTTIATVTINSGASSVWRNSTIAIDALLNNGTTHYDFTDVWTKTGTPGTLFVRRYLTYRMVAT